MNNVTIRRATLDDVPAITKMHADYSAYATLQLPYPTEKHGKRALARMITRHTVCGHY